MAHTETTFLNSLKAIAEEVRICTACPLAKWRTTPVPGEGPATARLMFIGEAPGRDEDIQGRPFIGRAGSVLNSALAGAGIQRKEVFISNVVKCRPPHNRKPTRRELEICIGTYLNREIQAVNPEIICLLGGTAVKALLGVDRLSAVRGKLIKKDRTWFATYHPAGAARNPVWLEAFQQDLIKLNQLLVANR